MTLRLNSKNAELAHELARLTGKPLVEALRDCLKRELERVRQNSMEQRQSGGFDAPDK